MRSFWCLLALPLSGCLTVSPPLEVGPDTYTMSAGEYWSRYGDGAYEAAADRAIMFCKKLGKQYFLIDMTKGRNSVGAPTRELTFLCRIPPTAD